MLSVRPKITELSFNVFARSVHPELFEICNTRTYEREHYRLTLSITRDGHLIQFQNRNELLTEVTSSAFHSLPSQFNLVSHPILHPRNNVLRTGDVVYQSTAELEAVNPQIFVTIQQQLDARLECDGLVQRFESNGRVAFGAISYMHVQSFSHHVLIRSFHTFPDTCAVMKSESRFSVTE